MKFVITRKTVVIALLAVSLIGSSAIVMNWSKVATALSGLVRSSPQPTPPSVINPPYRPLVTVHYCKDGEPFYANAVAKQADIALANTVDNVVTANQSGAHVFVSYIDSSSFEHNALTIDVPAISAAPTPPLYPNLSDPYKQAQALNVYKKELPIWQAAYAAWQKNLESVKTHVHQETNMLRSLKPAPYDNTGSSIWGCLFSAWLNFQGTTGNKVLVIASEMVQNVTDPLPSGFTLSGITIEVIFHTCITSAAACAANDANWRQIFKRYGASKISFSSVQESQVQPVSL